MITYQRILSLFKLQNGYLVVRSSRRLVLLRHFIRRTLYVVIWTYTSFAQRVNLDFSNARKDESGALCIKQEVCIPAEGLQALADELPPGPCIADPRGCNCESDEDCGGGSAR